MHLDTSLTQKLRLMSSHDLKLNYGYKHMPLNNHTWQDTYHAFGSTASYCVSNTHSTDIFIENSLSEIKEHVLFVYVYSQLRYIPPCKQKLQP